MPKNDFDYLSHDEDGSDVDVDLMEDTSDGEEISDDEEEETIDSGKVQDSEDGGDNSNEEMDITPVKPKSKPKAKKARPTSSGVVNKSPKAIKPKPTNEKVDVSQFTRARFHKTSAKDSSKSILAYVLAQPNTVDKRVITSKKAKAPPITQQIQSMISDGTLTRDNCVKVITFNKNGDPTGFRSTFEYHFGIWTLNGEFQPLNVAQEKLLISADFKSKSLKGPHQTPVKWIRDKKNMADPESYHVINHEGKAHNVPMPVSFNSCIVYYDVYLTYKTKPPWN